MQVGIGPGFVPDLDMTHPGAQEYIRQVVKSAVEDLGYKFLKLDFLYAAAYLASAITQPIPGRK